MLVHYFADGSGWQAVSNILTRDGCKVSVVQQPETSFDDDVKATRRVVDAQDGPASSSATYGGAVITEAGNGSRASSAWPRSSRHRRKPARPDQEDAARDEAIKATEDGHLYFDEASFHADFAADVPAAEAKFMAISQVTPAAQSFGVPITHAAWRTKPSWAVVATADRAINPELERFMTQRAARRSNSSRATSRTSRTGRSREADRTGSQGRRQGVNQRLARFRLLTSSASNVSF